MREARSEGCHCGKTGSGVAKIRGDGAAEPLRREALWKEGSEGEQLALVLLLEENASLWWLLWWWWWWWLLSRVTEGVLAVATVAEALFLRCGGTYDIVLRNLLVGEKKKGVREWSEYDNDDKEIRMMSVEEFVSLNPHSLYGLTTSHPNPNYKQIFVITYYKSNILF